MNKYKNINNSLIFLTLISFSFFGSFSHLFSLSLIATNITFYFRYKKSNKGNRKALILFSTLSSCFYLILAGGIFRNSLDPLLHALSPMLPIALISFLILFDNSKKLRISSTSLSQFSQISVLFSSIICLILSTFPEISLLAVCS